MKGVTEKKGPGYEINGEIMILAVALLACAVFFTFCLHFYAKWFWRHSATLTLNVALGSSRRRRFTFAEEGDESEDNAAQNADAGLDRAVIDALPLFVYGLQGGCDGGSEGFDCAVCLCGFEENDKGRLLPNCKHAFHVDCIEMWFHSHSTCPLCRARVQPQRGIAVGSIELNHEGDSSGDNSGEGAASNLEEGGTSSDPAKFSAVTRICSLRRLLGRENKVFPSNSGGDGDVEEGGGQIARPDLEIV